MLFDYTNNEALFCYESTLKIWNIIIKLKNSSKMSNWRFHQNSRVNERKVTIKQKKNRQTPEKKTTDYHKILLTNVIPLHSTERNMYTN